VVTEEKKALRKEFHMKGLSLPNTIEKIKRDRSRRINYSKKGNVTFVGILVYD